MTEPFLLSGLCPVPHCLPPYRGCDQFAEMFPAWTMLPFEPFAGLNPHVLWADGNCAFTSSCYLDCARYPAGMCAVWYVQVNGGKLPYGNEVLVPGQDACEFTGSCPRPAHTLP